MTTAKGLRGGGFASSGAALESSRDAPDGEGQ
jgi:hypothetical protein